MATLRIEKNYEKTSNAKTLSGTLKLSTPTCIFLKIGKDSLVR